MYILSKEDYINKVFSPRFIIDTLQNNHLALNKKLGQNFLINRRIADFIIEKSAPSKEETLLEIGPGIGTITFLLAQRARRVIAVEYDAGFYRYLSTYSGKLGYSNVYFLHSDFLKLSEKELIQTGTPCKVVSNFPFSISIKAIIHLLEGFKSIKSIYGTVQKEVAERLGAPPGAKSYSLVSVIVQYLATVSIVQSKISPKNYFPTPEVWSAVIEVKRRENRLGNNELFFRVVKAAFINRRKSLINNLALGLGLDKNLLSDIVRESFKDLRIRAESLSVEDFVFLSKSLKNLI